MQLSWRDEQKHARQTIRTGPWQRTQCPTRRIPPLNQFPITEYYQIAATLQSRPSGPSQTVCTSKIRYSIRWDNNFLKHKREKLKLYLPRKCLTHKPNARCNLSRSTPAARFHGDAMKTTITTLIARNLIKTEDIRIKDILWYSADLKEKDRRRLTLLA